MYLYHGIVALVFVFTATIDGRHTDTQRDFSTCPQGHIPCAIKNSDGFLKLTCFKPRCEEITKVKETCTEGYTDGCPKGSWVGSIHREFVGANEKPRYKCKCCSHPIFQKTVSIRPIPDFLPGAEARDASAGQGDYIDIVSNVLKNHNYDHHGVEITSVVCHSSTTRSTATAKPTTHKPDNHHEGNNGAGGGGGGGHEGGGHEGGGHGDSHEGDCGPTGNCKPKLEGGANEIYEKQRVPAPKPVAASANTMKAWGVDTVPSGGHHGGGGGANCFPADTLVHTRSGEKRMDEIELGDEILSSIALDGKTGVDYQPITQFIHKDPNVFTRYTTIHTQSGRSISLTPYHLIPQFECHRFESGRVSVRDYDLLFAESARFANRARAGQCVLAIDFDGKFVAEQIANVTSAVRQGVFSPITASGIIVANGVQASCYSSVENHALQHAFFTFMHKVSLGLKPYMDYVKNIFSSRLITTQADDDGQVPILLRGMLILSNLVMGSGSY
jgi:hypothetical protein